MFHGSTIAPERSRGRQPSACTSDRSAATGVDAPWSAAILSHLLSPSPHVVTIVILAAARSVAAGRRPAHSSPTIRPTPRASASSPRPIRAGSSPRSWWTTCRRRARCRRRSRCSATCPGTIGRLAYVEELNRYFRAVDDASPRVKVFSLGMSDEGREMIVAAIADSATIARLDDYRAMTARLADPRGLAPAERARLDQGGQADLLAHGKHPFPGDGQPRDADGAAVPARRGGERSRHVDPQRRHHAHHAGDRGRRARPAGGRGQALAVAQARPERRVAHRTGASTRRTTTTATAWCCRRS